MSWSGYRVQKKPQQRNVGKKLRSDGERVLMVAGDPYRPAALNNCRIGNEWLEVVADSALKRLTGWPSFV
jgi:hypothetical protein